MPRTALKHVDEDQVTNGGHETIEEGIPYIARVGLVGLAGLMFHRWNVEAVATKAGQVKGSIAKKSDNVESYVWRVIEGDARTNLGLPGEYFRQSVIHAAKYIQDPRSPRKSGMDLFKAGLVSLTEIADLGVSDWDYLDQRRVTVQRAGITRTRPAMNSGWHADFELMINLPEYISPELLHQVISNAGRLVGVGDFRPTFGRFGIRSWEIVRAID
jgi:hypothetical protein